MSEQGLQAEIRRLTKERDQLRADLRAERGEAVADEVIVRRYGTDPVSLQTFHVQFSVDTAKALREGAKYLDALVLRARAEIDHQLELVRRGAGAGLAGPVGHLPGQEPWPAGCIKPNSCSRHAQCMYARDAGQCRHYGKDLTADVRAAEQAREWAAAAPAGQRP